MTRELSKNLEWLESHIRKTSFGAQPISLYEPIRYIMSLGGKRLRPLLTLISYSLYKNNPRSIVPYAAAVEAFHNFTLMHDDIMDKAPLRRGKATVHKKWNVNTAILAGDVMLVKVYEMFVGLEPELMRSVLIRLNKCAAGVCEGQQWDMEFESRASVTEAEYINMIRLKTAVLVGFSLELGALLANASPGDQKLLRDFGTNIGIGFQLKDDLLDAYGDPKKFGKQIGGDILANKKTFLLIKALELARGKNRTTLHSWLNGTGFSRKDKIAGVLEMYDKLGVRALTEKKANSYFQKAFKKLSALDIPPVKKQVLNDFTASLLDRQS
jgi:geranylgeranyl diphosphate synthase, type II